MASSTKQPFFSNYQKRGSAPTKAKQQSDNLIESIRDIGAASGNQLKKDLVGAIPEEVMRQILGFERPPLKFNGELKKGQTLDIARALEEEKGENKLLKAQVLQERQLREEEKALLQKKSKELKLELHALNEEVAKLANTTLGLARETKIATLQAPANPGIYHVVFFEKLREFILSFRKKIENASLWLQSYNQRAAKKRNFWGLVSQSGAKRLLSAEDYSQRSAG